MTALPSAMNSAAFQGGYVDPKKDPRRLGENVPTSESIPSLAKEIRRDAKAIAQWTLSHLNNSLANREHLDRLWTRVDSYMAGFHYFDIDSTGAWRSKPLKDGEVRATVPLMRSFQRRELGRFTENVLTVQALAASPNNRNSFHHARRAELLINAWQEETGFADVYEEWCNQQIHYGLSALHRYICPLEKQVKTCAWPARELHPIPWNATKDDELEGFMRVKTMTRAWIEQNVGPEAARLCGKSQVGKHAGTFISSGSPISSPSDDVGNVTWVWLLPTKETPTGQHYLMVEDEMFFYVATAKEGIAPPLRNGKLPVEFSRYSKGQGNWYGMGFLGALLGAQAEADRQWSKIVRSGRLNDGILFVDDSVVNMTDLQDYEREVLTFDTQAYDPDQPFYHYLPPASVNRDVGAALTIASEHGRLAAGHESDILYGKAEGRVESGPLGRILNVNAQAPIAPTLGRMARAMQTTFDDVLNMLGEVWPQQKVVRTVGEGDVVEEEVIRRDQVPTSEMVYLRPSPLLPAGRMEMFNLLMQLRQMPADNGKPEISSAEFRKGLSYIRMSPPGIQLTSEKEQRIRQRVLELFNDGKTPGKLARDSVDMKLLLLEDAGAMRDALVTFMLKPGFSDIASVQVKLAFFELLRTMRSQAMGDAQDTAGYDENLDIAQFDANKMEEFLDAAEQDPFSPSGQMYAAGVPV